MIETVVVLCCVSAHDVVVVRVLQAENQSASTVYVARDGLEPHTELQIPEASVVSDEQRKPVVGTICRSLCDYVRFRGGRRLSQHYPPAFRSLPRPGAMELGRHATWAVAVKVVGDRLTRSQERGGRFRWHSVGISSSFFAIAFLATRGKYPLVPLKQ